jgi:tetratricopeptide (TPR) repeat protein
MNFHDVLLTVFKNIKLVIPFFIFLSSSTMAESSSEAEFNKYFKTGEYSEAINVLGKANSADFGLGQISYLEGISYSLLQEFDKAINSFEKAILDQNRNPDLQYAYGQALYAANELKAARAAFKESALGSFNRSVSKYYVAHISQMLEEYFVAKEMYIDLIKMPETDISLKQIARFQLAETVLASIKEEKLKQVDAAKYVSRSVVPLLSQAIKTDEKAQIAEEIGQRLFEIQVEYDIDPDLLRNGRRISSKRYSGYLSQKLKFDNNVTLTNEENNIQQTTKTSFVFASEAYAKYDFVLNKKFITTPEFRYTFDQYSDKKYPEVYQNDSYSFNANLKNKYEHIINDQPASFLFDLELGKTFKDWQQVHKRVAYADSVALGIGESFNYFHSGDTTFRMKYKIYNGVNELTSNHTLSFSGDQMMSLANQNLLIVSIEADFINNFNNPLNNSNTFMGRFDYIVPEIRPLYTLDLAFTTTLTDTKAQKEIRGTEMTINPSIQIAREISEKIKILFNYDYTKNSSKSVDYDYKKSIFTLGLNYSF